STSLSKLARAPSVSVHPDTAAVLDLADGDEVIATTSGGSAQVPVIIDADLAPGTVSVTANLDATFDLGADLAVSLEKVGS
ncbi:MAG: hypothetical protein OES38_23220, partial [Gammaproteobacteria bacterium]|nr:hypothetical protein [Gammaproteobacteria bacterium]